MFCPNCGKPLPDDSVFCDQCGASIEPEPKQDTPSFPEELPVDAAVKQGPGTMAGLLQLAKEHQKATGILAIVVIAVVALILFLALKLPTVRLNDYLIVEYSGYNTMGTASYRFDTEAFCRDYAETVQYQGAGTSSFLTGEEQCQMLLRECVGGDLDRTSGLSNGEELTFVWNCNDDMAKSMFGVNLSYKDLTISIDTLDEPQEIDPFANVELTYSGIGPNGEASLTNHSEESYASGLQFDLQPSTGLSNGDTITVSVAQADTEEGRAYYLRNYGITFSQTQKEYTVVGLGSYVSKLSELSEDVLTKMRSQCEDAIRAEAARTWSDGISLDSLSYQGSYLLTAKNPSDTRTNNMLYLVYQVQSTANLPEDGVHESFSYYYAVRFDDLTVVPDGTVSVSLDEYDTTSDTFSKKFGDRSFRYRGYEDLDSAFQECVSTNLEQYAYESNIKTE